MFRAKEAGRQAFPFFLLLPFVSLFLLTLLAAWPVLRAARSVPTVGDGPNHFYRLVELDWAIRHGVIFPRWMPDLGYGYGMPLFVYYPPLAYYVAEVFRLIGFSFAGAMLAAYALALGLAAIGAYAWGRDIFGETGGFVTAAAYAFAPYLYLNVLARGALPEALALGLLPWLFWAYRRLALSPGRNTFFAAVLLHTAFTLTHTLSALVATPLVALYIAMLGVSANQQSEIRNQKLPGSLFIVSLFIPFLLSAFFWWPALFETEYVQAGKLFIPALDYHNHFLTLGTLLAAPKPFDPKLVFFDFPASLGWPQIGLTVIGLMVTLSHAFQRMQNEKSDRGRAPSAFPLEYPLEAGLRPTHFFGAWIILIGLAFLTHPASVRIWETLPLIRYLQFPWRLVGPASLMLALAAGGGGQTISSMIGSRSWELVIGNWRLRSAPAESETAKCPFGVWDLPALVRARVGFGIWLLALLSFWLFSLPWTFTAEYENLGQPTVADIAKYEQTSGHLGTTSAGEFLPVGVTELPAPDSLAARYATNPIIARLDRASLPPEATVVAEANGLNRAEATIESPAPFTAIFDWFYFPGWRAEIDGLPASISARGPNGLIAVDVPAGRHTVNIRFGPTPLRRAGDAISFLTLIGLVVWGLTKKDEGEKRKAEATLLPSSLILPPLLIGLLLFRILYLDNFPNPFSHTRFDGTTVGGVMTPLSVNFDHRLELIGLDLPGATVRSGETLNFDLYWRPLDAPLDADYSVAAHLVDANGAIFGQADSQHPDGVPTSRWRADQYALDRHRLRVLPGTPPGPYRLVAGVYRFDTSASLSIRDENDIPQGTTTTLAEITVTRPARFPTDAELAPAILLIQPLGPLTLVGYDLANDGQPVTAGSPLSFTLFWRAGRDVPPERLPERLAARIELTAADGAVILSEDLPPARADYPTTEWMAGEAVRVPHAIQIPADAPAGAARFQLSLIDENGTLVAGPLELTEIAIIAPERSTRRPPIAHPLDVIFGGAIRLIGYDLAPESPMVGQPFRLTLYWESLTPVSLSYTVFTHLLDSTDHIRAQKDSPPLGGARPTTGWLAGEVLSDVYELTVEGDAPPGEYAIEAGLYDSASGQRLPVLDAAGQAGDDRVIVTRVRVER